MKEEHKKKLEIYARLKQEIKALEEKAETLNSEVLEIMKSIDVEEVSIGDLGKLTLGERRTWKYSADVENAKKYLDDKKKEEERTGKADYTLKHYVIFKTNSEVGN